MEASLKRLYLDHAATTPLHPTARAAWEAAVAGGFGNPSSLHEPGRAAKAALDDARAVIADELGCEFAEVVFTSGGTEGAHLAILGAALGNVDRARNRVLLGAAEHPCVLGTAETLARLGYRVETVPVDRDARVDLAALEAMLGPDTLLLSLMHANNELGTLQPLAEARERTWRHGVLLHCDAVQSFCVERGPARPFALGCDLVSVSAHKVGGPVGIGALAVRAGTKLAPPAKGGGQEREMRGGTEAVALAAGFAAAVRVAREADYAPVREAREAFLEAVTGPEATPTVADRSWVLPGHAHLLLSEIDAETALIRLDRMGIAAGSGSACSSGSLEPSHVLVAAGRGEAAARRGLRFTFGRGDGPEIAREAAARTVEALRAIRAARG